MSDYERIEPGLQKIEVPVEVPSIEKDSEEQRKDFERSILDFMKDRDLSDEDKEEIARKIVDKFLR